MATDTEFIQELECQSIHMRHWKHRYQFVTGLHGQYIKSKLGVRPEGAIGNHDSLRIAGSSGSIIDDCQLFGFIATVTYVFASEIARKLLSEQFIQMIAGIVEPFAARYQ